MRKDIVTFGGARLAQALVRQGLMDEYQLMLNPAILGQGLPLFKDVTTRQTHKLVSYGSYNGAVALRYIPGES